MKRWNAISASSDGVFSAFTEWLSLFRIMPVAWYVVVRTTHPNGRVYESVEVRKKKVILDVWRKNVLSNKKNREYMISISQPKPLS